MRECAPAMGSKTLEASKQTMLLETQDLTKVYRRRRFFSSRPSGGTVAVSAVNLRVEEGEALGLVGESGSGKSTIARLVMGLEQPSAGSITFQGEPIAKMRRSESKDFYRKAQIVFQDPKASLDPRMKVRDSIAEPLDVLDRPSKAERKKRIGELLDEVGLGHDLAVRYPHQLSGGECQRVGIARALSVGPKLVVLDEPVSSLDVSIRAQILNLLLDLKERHGLTYLYISHDLATVRQVCDWVAVMKEGKIVEEAETERLFDAPTDEYTRRLIAAVPSLSAILGTT